MAYLSEQEKISFLMMQGWRDRKRFYNEVKELFNQIFRNSQISKFTIQTIKCFENGLLKNQNSIQRSESATRKNN